MCRPKCKKTTTDYHGAASQRLFSSQTAVSLSQKYLKRHIFTPPRMQKYVNRYIYKTF